MSYNQNYLRICDILVINKSFLFLTILLLLFSALFNTACGSKRNPTGGKLDVEKPQVLATIPEQFGNITEQKIEISFSKPIDRASFLKGMYIYPPVQNKKIYYDANVITIKFLEALEKDTNYFITLTTRIKDIRGNALDKNQTLIFRHGALQNNRISGLINYEEPKDNGLPILLTMLTADSLWVLSQNLSGSSYVLEALNPLSYILRAYIDKNSNGRYDYGIEPFFEAPTPMQSIINLDFNLAYADTVKPVLKYIRPISKREYILTLNKPVKSYKNIEITSLNNKSKLPIFHSLTEMNTITVYTAETDTTHYRFSIVDAIDNKGNKKEVSSLTIKGTDKPDVTSPMIVQAVPRNGTSVNTLLPILEITFSELIPKDKFHATIKEAESGTYISYNIIQANHKTYKIQPEKPLTNYRTCQLTIESTTTDLSGNPLKEPYKLVFLPIYRSK